MEADAAPHGADAAPHEPPAAPANGEPATAPEQQAPKAAAAAAALVDAPPAPDAAADAPAAGGAGGEADAGAGGAASTPSAAVAPPPPAPPPPSAMPPPPPPEPPKPKVFDVGMRVMAQASFDQQYHAADVVDRRGTGDAVKYYVHYVDYNKRVDEWLAASRVEYPLAGAASGADALGLHGVPSSGALGGGASGAPGGGGAPLAALPSALGGFGGGLTCATSLPGGGPTVGLAALGIGSPSAALLSPTASDANGMLSPSASAAAAERKLTRHLKRRYDEMHHIARPVEELAPLEQSLEREHEEKTKVKNIQAIELGRYEMDTWYYSPYPAEYAAEHSLLMCEFCLKYMRKRKTLLAHKLRCAARAPPGTEIYRHPARPGAPPLSMWEVDGKRAHTYCQSLCLLAKLFLDHKTLYYDVDPFLFYVLTERDDAAGCHHLVGYFSKEKASTEDFNLACILTLPPYQRKGYGRFLIAFSYELSKVEQRIGTPERPLSDLGAVSYRSYWTRTVLEVLRDFRGNVSVKDITARTAIRQDDVVSTLQGLGLLKWWKGQHIISVTPRLIEEHLKVCGAPNRALDIDPSRLQWTPYGSLVPPRR